MRWGEGSGCNRNVRAYDGEEGMRIRIRTITTVAAVLLLGALLVACSGGDAEDRKGKATMSTPTPGATSTPTISPTPTPDPNAYMAEKVALTMQGSVVVRETFRYNEEGVFLESVTEQKAVDALDDAWELISHTTCTGEFTVKRVTECYEAGVLQSVQTEVTEEDGATRTQYAYYTDGVMTQRDTEETDGTGRTECTWTEIFAENGARTFLREVYYRDDAYATPLLVKTAGADGGETVRSCPDNRYIAANGKLPALAYIEVTEPDGNRYCEIRIGSFYSKLSVNPVAVYRDMGNNCDMYILEEAYDGCDWLKLLYTADGKGDLYCAMLGTQDNEEKLVWNRDKVTQKRIGTDRNGSFCMVDVHEDGTEIVRSETKQDDNRRLLSKETYDSFGNLTYSLKCEYSSDGRTLTSRELIKKDNGTEVTFVKTLERDDNGKTARIVNYTQEGGEVIGRKQWDYRYDERGDLESTIYTAEDGTAVETTYTYTYLSRKK